MRGTVICLALLYVFVGVAGLCAAGLCAASVSAQGQLRGAPEQAAERAAEHVTEPVTPSAHANKPCTSLEQAYEQAQSGDAEAQCRLARQYEAGLCGLCKDDPLAVVWFKKAAAAGRAEAQFAVGMRSFFGLGVQQDIEQAVYWLHKAAQQGHAEAQYRLAGCLEDGLGAAAVNWYTRSAELGYPQAQNMLGVLCINGLGVQRDAQAAAAWFHRAAVQGYATAQYNLARSYEKG